MQIVESDIVIPLKYKSRVRGILIQECVVFVLFVVVFGSTFYSTLQMSANPSRFQEIVHQELFEAITGGAMLVLFSLLFIFMISKLRAPSPYLRINHEGIFTSQDAFLIRWSEIKELSTSTFMEHSYVKIVPWNGAEGSGRANALAGLFLRPGVNGPLMLFSHTKTPVLVDSRQMVLPISTDELLAAIQAHFALELRAYRILIRREAY